MKCLALRIFMVVCWHHLTFGYSQQHQQPKNSNRRILSSGTKINRNIDDGRYRRQLQVKPIQLQRKRGNRKYANKRLYDLLRQMHNNNDNNKNEQADGPKDEDISDFKTEGTKSSTIASRYQHYYFLKWLVSHQEDSKGSIFGSSDSNDRSVFGSAEDSSSSDGGNNSDKGFQSLFEISSKAQRKKRGRKRKHYSKSSSKKKKKSIKKKYWTRAENKKGKPVFKKSNKISLEDLQIPDVIFTDKTFAPKPAPTPVVAAPTTASPGITDEPTLSPAPTAATRSPTSRPAPTTSKSPAGSTSPGTTGSPQSLVPTNTGSDQDTTLTPGTTVAPSSSTIGTQVPTAFTPGTTVAPSSSTIGTQVPTTLTPGATVAPSSSTIGTQVPTTIQNSDTGNTFQVEYVVSGATPDDAQFEEAETVTLEFLEAYIRSQFDLNPLSVLDSFAAEATGNTVNPVLIAYNVKMTFTADSAIVPTAADLDLLIQSAFLPNASDGLLDQLQGLDASNPFTTTTDVIYTDVRRSASHIHTNIKTEFSVQYNFGDESLTDEDVAARAIITKAYLQQFLREQFMLSFHAPIVVFQCEGSKSSNDPFLHTYIIELYLSETTPNPIPQKEDLEALLDVAFTDPYVRPLLMELQNLASKKVPS